MLSRKEEAAGAVCDALAGGDHTASLRRAVDGYSGKRSALTSSVDGALHTALYLCGLKRGAYVFMPTYTYYSYATTVVAAGGVPVFIDSDPITRCMSAAALETALVWAKLQDRLPSAVIIDDAFGSVADYDVLCPVCKSEGVPVIELACEALYGEYKGVPCGANGDYGVIGFAKRLGGVGGALIVGASELCRAEEFIRAQYSAGESHDYKMPNIVAALDDALFAAAKRTSDRAKANLAALCSLTDILHPVDGDGAAYAAVKRPPYIFRGAKLDVKKPPLVHTLPQYAPCAFFEHEQGFCVADTLSECCLVGLDISAAKRNRLIKIINRSQSL